MTGHDHTAPLLHVCAAGDWTGQDYAPVGLVRDGFIHLCTATQIGFVMRRHFAGRTGLVMLHIDPARCPAPLRWERSEPDQEPFPHLYGPVPAAAVLRVDALG